MIALEAARSWLSLQKRLAKGSFKRSFPHTADRLDRLGAIASLRVVEAAATSCAKAHQAAADEHLRGAQLARDHIAAILREGGRGL